MVVVEPVPDVVDADADRDEIRLLVEYVALESRDHVRRLVPADPGVDHLDVLLRIDRIEVVTKQPHIPARVLPNLGDAVTEAHDAMDVCERGGNGVLSGGDGRDHGKDERGNEAFHAVVEITAAPAHLSSGSRALYGRSYPHFTGAYR